MPFNPYDQAARYLARLDAPGFLAWLLGVSTSAFAFEGWLNTRTLPFPGDPERTCDTVAFLRDLASGEPWAVVIEFQITPDGLMFGRLLVYQGQLWLAIKPYPERGDRFNVASIVVNLTGKGNSGRRMRWDAASLETVLERPDRNIGELRADAVLTGIESGTITPAVLGLIPLMQGGDEDGIIRRWKACADADVARRGDHKMLALIFADAVGRVDTWKNALEDWNVIQSKIVMEWQAQARTEMLVQALEGRFGPVPADLIGKIQATTDPTVFKQWMTLAVRSSTLDQFRQDAGLGS